jgi:hypothetical protein
MAWGRGRGRGLTDCGGGDQVGEGEALLQKSDAGQEMISVPVAAGKRERERERERLRGHAWFLVIADAAVEESSQHYHATESLWLQQGSLFVCRSSSWLQPALASRPIDAKM